MFWQIDNFHSIYTAVGIQKFADKFYHSSLNCFLVGFTDDYCQVKLTEIPREEGSDYIIASMDIAKALYRIFLVQLFPYPADLSYSTI